MTDFSVGGPQTIFDWAALREEFSSKLDLLNLDSLSILYGLSKTIGYRDDEFAQLVEEHLSKSPDPVRIRFDLAYQLCSHFWDYYEHWLVEVRQTDEPGYVGGMLDNFNNIVMSWIVDGLVAYSDESDVMDSAYFIISRIGNYDTFLEEKDIALMEAAAKKEISIETSKGGRELLEIIRNFYRDHSGEENEANDKTLDDPDANK